MESQTSRYRDKERKKKRERRGKRKEGNRKDNRKERVIDKNGETRTALSLLFFFGR